MENKSAMENKSKLQEEEMKKVSGGDGLYVMICHCCGKSFPSHMAKEYIDHLRSCTGKSDE